MGTLNCPNFNAWLANVWGAGSEFSAVCGAFYGATNLVFGQNPPYYLDDFLAMYPKFFGTPTAFSNCVVTTGQNTFTVPSTAGLNFGQFVQAPGILAPGSVITGISGNTITLNNNAIASNANFTVMAYTATPIPIGVITLYLNLAYDSLVQARWQEQWTVAMGWFIAHYCTLYARSDAGEVFGTLATAIHGETPTGAIPGTAYAISAAPPGGVLQALTKNGNFLIPGVDYTLGGTSITLTAATVNGDVLYATWPVQISVQSSISLSGAAIAARGLAGGIQTSKSVGDVSVSYQPLSALEDWGQWNLTIYGQQLATMARVVGAGPMVIW